MAWQRTEESLDRDAALHAVREGAAWVLLECGGRVVRSTDRSVADAALRSVEVELVGSAERERLFRGSASGSCPRSSWRRGGAPPTARRWWWSTRAGRTCCRTAPSRTGCSRSAQRGHEEEDAVGGWLAERFGLTVPVVAAPMAGVSTGGLAAAVTAAGGLGTIAVGPTTTADQVRAQCAEARAGGPFGVGLMAWALAQDDALLDVVVAEQPALVSVSYGPYERWVARLQDAGVVVATQAGTLEEAVAAERAGVDLLVARGSEGGGHGRGDVATLPLLQAVLDAVRLPVLAAGGVGTARGLAAVLAAGAAGAWVGTAFLACIEAATSPAARERLLAAEDTGTAYGRVFDVGQRLAWPPEYGGRALRNAFFDAWEGREDELARDDAAAEQLRTARVQGDLDVACVYAGQGVGLLREERTAADVVRELAGAQALLARAAAT